MSINMSNLVFERARTFMYRNARPLDMVRFQYHFENGRKEASLVKSTMRTLGIL